MSLVSRIPFVFGISATLRAVLTALALLAVILPAGAQTTYTSSAAFFAALGAAPYTTEGYETQALNSLINSGDTVDGLTYTAFPTGTQGRIDNLYNNIGNQSLALQRGTDNTSFFFGGDSFTVTFPTPVTAVGIFFNANQYPGSADGDYFLQTPVGTAGTGAAYDQSTLYFAGLISNTPFNTATIGSSLGNNGQNSFNVDNLTYAPAVPEVSTTISFGLLLVLGLGGVIAAKRKRASSAV